MIEGRGKGGEWNRIRVLMRNMTELMRQPVSDDVEAKSALCLSHPKVHESLIAKTL